MTYLKKYPLALFLFLHFMVWSLVPLLRQSLPMDSIEAIVWGMYCDFGTNKHPPLSGWLANFFYHIIGFEKPYAIYALNQLCVLTGFVYIYRLAKEFVGEEKAVLSVMLLEGVIYYGFSSLEYNVNVVSLALWPMCVFYFYKAVRENKFSDWTLTGVLAGLNLLNKYTSGVLLISMGLFMLVNKKARYRLLRFKPYWCLFVCCAVISCHLIWLYQNDFFVLDYFIGRGGKAGFENFPLLRHIVYPLKFISAQVLFGLGSVLIYFIAKRGEEPMNGRFRLSAREFLEMMGICPIIIMFLISLVFGIKLKSMWGFPCLYLLGLLLIAFFPYELSEKFKKKIAVGVYVMMFLMAFAQIMVILFNKSEKFHLNANAFAAKVEDLWHDHAGHKAFEYVVGDVWLADNVALFAPSKPKPVIWGDIRQNPWFDQSDLKKKGAIIVAPSEEEYDALKDKLKITSKPFNFELEIKNRLGKTKKKIIYYGFYNTSGEKN